MHEFDQNLFYREAVNRITSTLNIGQTLQRCLRYLEGVLPADGMQIHLWEPDLCAMRILATVNRETILEPDELIPVPPPFRSIPEWHRHDNVKIVNVFEEDPISSLIQDRVINWYRSVPYSYLVMRVQLEGQRICDIAVLAEGAGRFSAEHASLLDLLHQPFAIAVSNALRHRELQTIRNQLATRNNYLCEELDRLASHAVIGAHSGLRDVMRQVDQVAATDAPVLLLGETGVGKDMLAQHIFSQSRRNEQPLVRVNCGAIPESLLNSELFGHERGAFTDARQRHLGHFERANGGTIFLDEIGELSSAAQVMLLRVLQDGEFERVGGGATISVDVRIIAATNRDLKQRMEDGLFRRDLFYRLNVFPITIPPLRERLDDLPLLLEYLLQQTAERMNLLAPRLAPEAMSRLRAYDWPGNVRELANVIEHALIRSPAGPLTFEGVEATSPPKSRRGFFPDCGERPLPLDEVNRYYFRHVLDFSQGKIDGPGGAAELLQINPHTLRSRLKRLGVPYGRQGRTRRRREPS